MKMNLDHTSEETRIELIPLIDVIFCILSFFLLAALQLTRQQAINVDLPKASTGQPQMREMLIVSLDIYGQIYLDQIPINPQQLEIQLKQYQAINPGGLMVLYAPKDAKYNDVVQVLDKMRLVGGDKVALATLPSAAPVVTPNPSLGNPTPSPSSTIPPNNSFPNPVPPSAPITPNLYQTPIPNSSGIPFNPNTPIPPNPNRNSQLNLNQNQPPLTPGVNNN